jgi:hypothetical protein
MRARLIFAFVTIVVVVLGVTSTGMADPNLGNVPDHRHWVQNSSGDYSQVGPKVCDDPTNEGLQKSFNQFHNNIHAVTPTGIGQAAPGLHNGKGADMTFSSCAVLLG